jgi:hypothetical protein
MRSEPGTAPHRPVRAAAHNPCSQPPFICAAHPCCSVCAQSLPDPASHLAQQKTPQFSGFSIGAPGFEPGTSPTRITRAPSSGQQEIPARRAFCRSPQATSDPRICGEFPAIGHKDARCAQSSASRDSPASDRSPPLLDAAPVTVRAADQLPHTAVTTLAAGDSPRAKRSSASPPRRRACVRDQSYEDGSLP